MAMKVPRCARCGESDFIRAGKTLCDDCAKWFGKLSLDAKILDKQAWKKA